MKKNRLLLLILFMIVLLSLKFSSLACGPFFEQAVFTYQAHPDFPLDDFAGGDLGVILPTYARAYLYAAYRHLTGIGFDMKERDAFMSRGQFSPDRSWNRTVWDAMNYWLIARNRVPNAGPDPKIETYSWRRIGSSRIFYQNYTAGAFETASETLGKRIETFGADSQEVLDWLRAQDMVFSNSSDYVSIPEPASSDAHPLAQADRAYQIAAANFYACNFDVAERMFREIAADANSPWSQIAAYLVCRTLIRKATLSAGFGEINTAVAMKAEEELKKILSNSNLKDMHSSAQDLLSFLRFRLHPDEVLYELSHSLLRKNSGETLGHDLSDYTLMLDRLLSSWNINKEFQEIISTWGSDDLTDWIITFQSNHSSALDHALEKWRKTASMPWLLAALVKINGEDYRAEELLKAASEVGKDSPAFHSVAFHSIRLMIQMGRADQAREALDSLISQDGVPPSSLNLFLAQRISLARDIDEFLKYAPRVPAGAIYDGMPGPLPDEDFKSKYALLDMDSAVVLDKYMPLTLLRDICVRESFPLTSWQHVLLRFRRDLTLAAWVKAILLDDEKISIELAPVLSGLVPELRDYLNRYVSEKSSEARKFTAVFLMLKYPGMHPFIGSGLGRTTPLNEIDDFRYNWWCSFDPNRESRVYSYQMEPYISILVDSTDSPNFLTENQKSLAGDEWQKLSRAGTGPNYLCFHVINWARKMPDDPRVPEALHLAVKSTRYGCVDEGTSAFSREAFQLLHRRYPKSTWAGKTKYWY